MIKLAFIVQEKQISRCHGGYLGSGVSERKHSRTLPGQEEEPGAIGVKEHQRRKLRTTRRGRGLGKDAVLAMFRVI